MLRLNHAVLFFLFGWSVVIADEPRLRDRIDDSLASAWQREKQTPAAPSTDAEFLRRVSLDLVGTIPTHDEAVAFLDDVSPGKRDALIERLLADPRHAQHQADLWDLILFGRNPPGYDTDKRDGFQTWLREQFANNVPYDVLARTILKAEGNSAEQGAPLFFVQYRNQPEDCNEAITQTFLGIQLQCARCHDHPFEPWTQQDFFGMAAFLARLEVVQVGKKDELTMWAIGEKSTGDVLFTGPAAKQTPGKKGEPVKPKFLHAEPLVEPPLPDGFKEVKFENNKPPPAPQFSRKDQLAEWITKPDNPYFARAITNRIWSQFFGRGLVHPVDNMSPSKTPSHPELLDEMTHQLIAHQFDLRWLTRELVSSRAYQLSSNGSTGEPMPLWFEHARSRPLSAEELVASWRVATGFDVVEAAKEKPDDKKPKSKSRFRPLEGGYVLRFFGQPNNGTGDFQGGLQEHLYLNNGQLGSLLVTGSGSLLDAIAKSDATPEERIDRLFLSLLTRRATDAEKQRFTEYLAADKNQERLRDAIWVLMTCGEFRFNH